MKRLTGFLLAGLLLLTAAPAWAQQAYLSGNIGFGIRPDARLSGAPVDIHDPDRGRNWLARQYCGSGK